MNIHNGQDLLELCQASDAATYLTDIVKPEQGDDDEDVELEDIETVTLSAQILCSKLKKSSCNIIYVIILFLR